MTIRRLVYSPKAYAWVKTQGAARAINLSEYIVSGQVGRKVGEVSTAQLTIRNPNKKFTRPGDPTFHPMDPITIWLQRLKGYPVQVFTGYLDDTPYYQFYPGVCTLRASCTLKRLLHTYWDPALPFVRDFMATYGWTVETQSGMLVNTVATAKPADLDSGDLPVLEDSSIGNLLYATLKHVGDWKPETIFIEKLPENIADKVAEVYDAFEEGNQQAREEIANLLRKIIGEGDVGDGGGDVKLGRNPKQLGKIVKVIQEIAMRRNIPPAFVIAVSIIESALGTNMHRAGAPYWGWFQQNITAAPYGNAGITATPTKEQAMNLEASCDLFCRAAGRRAKETPSFRSEANWRVWGETTQGAPGQFGVMSDAIRQAKGLISKYGQGKDDPLDPNDNLPGGLPKPTLGATIMGAEDPAAQGGVEVRSAGKPLPHPDTYPSAPNPPSSDGPRGPGGQTGEIPEGAKVKPKIYAPLPAATGVGDGFGQPLASRKRNHNGIDVSCPRGSVCYAPCDGKIGNFSQTTGFSGGGMIHFVFTEDVGDIKAGTVIGWGHVGEVMAGRGERVKGGQPIAKSNHPDPHVHFVQRSDSADMDGTTDPRPLFDALQKGETSPTAGGDAGGTGPDSAGDMLSTAKAAAFATTLEFPSMLETLESVGLQGAKSLLNDKSLFPFIEQLSGACLRQFQSMPNGNFYAFYPDYFGSLKHRVPYWEINDIEIIDGGISLTDANLATHVYVVGDTVPAFGETGGGLDALDRLVSGGVVNIFNAAQAGFVLQEPDDDAIRRHAPEDGDEKKTKAAITDTGQALAFLRRYGARPYVEEAEQIRSPYFEAFRAYQLFQQLWSQQFLTTFQFTFMPELYPGGLVAFPDHGIQCYIEEVTHSFDYESGFTTDANLSSPAALPSAPVPTSISHGMVTADIGATRAKGDRRR